MPGNIKKVGNWGAAKRLTNEVKGDIKQAVEIALKRVGLEAERKVVKYIEKQPTTWPPLSEAYKKRKAKEGHSILMLIRTGDYINRITSTVTTDKKKVFVGVRKGVKSKDGQKLWQIGAVLEFGRKGDKKKARPHFRPVNQLMRKKIKEQDLFGKTVLNYIKQKHSL